MKSPCSVLRRATGTYWMKPASLNAHFTAVTMCKGLLKFTVRKSARCTDAWVSKMRIKKPGLAAKQFSSRRSVECRLLRILHNSLFAGGQIHTADLAFFRSAGTACLVSENQLACRHFTLLERVEPLHG